jgi:hypothetical protein
LDVSILFNLRYLQWTVEILFRLNWTPEDVDIYKTTDTNSIIPPPWSYEGLFGNTPPDELLRRSRSGFGGATKLWP